MWHKGQKLVCIDEINGFILKGRDAGTYSGNNPKLHETVTCDGQYNIGKYDCVDILEYLLDEYNYPQSFLKKHFVPLEEWQDATEAVEELLNEQCVELTN